MSEISLTVSQDLAVQGGSQTDEDGMSAEYCDRLLREIESYETLGVGEITLAVSDANPAPHFRAMEEFAAKVMPRAGHP